MQYLGKPVDDGGTTYQPIIAVFSATLMMALAIAYRFMAPLYWDESLLLFVALSIVVLALLKLRDLEAFTNQFLGYDVLARRWLPYAYIYPFIEFIAVGLMIAKIFTLIAAPLAIFIGSIGAISVIKAVYINKHELRCACVGGNSNVPLGIVSLTENLMMILIGVWMLWF